jgi:hypothetical protein
MKYCRKARRATWYFLVQSVGGEEECSAYTLNMVVLKGAQLLALSPMFRTYFGP